MDILSDTLAALRTGRPSAARTDARAPWGLRFHEVPFAGFHVVLQGSCYLIPAGGGAPVALNVGDVVFLRGGTGHVLCDHPDSPVREIAPQRDPASPVGLIRVDGPGPRAVLLCGAYRLDVEVPHPLLNELPEVVHLPARPGRHLALRAAVDQLSAEVDRPRPGSDAVVAALVDLLLLYVLRAWYDDQPAQERDGWAAALTDPAVAAALTAIHDAPGAPWTVASLGARAGLSRAAFARRFTALVGEPPLAYLTTWRMTTASRLLRETDTPLSGVAERTGYTSEFAFAKAFKRRYGVPPGAYRRENRAA